MVEEKGRDRGRRGSLTAGGGVKVETPRDAVRLVQGQPSVPRTSRPFKSTVFWDSSYNVDEDPNLCGYHMDAGE